MFCCWLSFGVSEGLDKVVVVEEVLERIFLPSIKLRAIYFNTSSSKITGKEIFITAHHSSIDNGQSEKTT